MNTPKYLIILLLILFLSICCCLGVVLLGAGGYMFYQFDGSSWIPSPEVNEFPTSEENEVPTPFRNGKGTAESQSEDIIFPTTLPPATGGAFETLNTLKDENVPINDARDLALRLAGMENIPEVLDQPAQNYDVGDEKVFWVTNMDTDENFQISAALAYETPHSYFWIEDGIDYDEYELQELAETFENDIYPTNREFFGSEWSPGIDGDEHLYVVFSTGLGYSIAGYFSSVDSIHPLAHQYSNAHETFMMNADTIGFDEMFTYGVLAHEFQHMIHWYQDRNETTWLNEGFSELAALLNGYYESGFDSLYIWQPDIQLTDWPNNPDETTPHYGAAFLFVEYFLERFEDDATKMVVANPDNGMDSIDVVLEFLNKVDPLTGNVIGADDVFSDWAITNYLRNADVADGRYDYFNYPNAPQATETESITQCPFDWQTRDVQQYGVDYIKIDCDGSYTLNFNSTGEVGVLPIDPYSGNYAVWSNKGDESDMTLTQQFDFSGITEAIELNYKVWYDVEEGYDYVYVAASIDGNHWDILHTPSGTADDSSGNSYGWGYSGESIEWIQETVDLSRYAGEKTYIRFEYVTDAAVNGEGLLLDDVTIPQIGYQTDFETDNGGWESSGFVRLQNRLPQTYRVSIIKYGNEITVETIQVNNQQDISLPLELGKDVDYAVMVVSGTTRFTRQPAIYRFSMSE